MNSQKDDWGLWRSPLSRQTAHFLKCSALTDCITLADTHAGKSRFPRLVISALPEDIRHVDPWILFGLFYLAVNMSHILTVAWLLQLSSVQWLTRVCVFWMNLFGFRKEVNRSTDIIFVKEIGKDEDKKRSGNPDLHYINSGDDYWSLFLTSSYFCIQSLHNSKTLISRSDVNIQIEWCRQEHLIVSCPSMLHKLL